MGKLELSGRAAGRCVVFGEVLYDCFVDGQTTLGGAPFNVAWHLQGLGLEPLLISRIGRDEPGERILQRMAEWGMDRRGVQRDSKFPTGQVTVTTENGQPTFDIHANQAYDHIEGENAVATVHGVPPSLLYHGCLALRSDQSRSAWRQMCTSFPKTPRFLDINLRPPWWTDRRVSEAISGANWVKLNDEELFLLTSTDGKEGNSHLDAAHKICEHYNTEMLIVTRGEAGAMIFSAQGIHSAESVEVTDLKDTVGAGDAFSAVSIFGRARGWTPDTILERASAFASEICRIRGATIDDPGFYQDLRTQWEQGPAEPHTPKAGSSRRHGQKASSASALRPAGGGR